MKKIPSNVYFENIIAEHVKEPTDVDIMVKLDDCFRCLSRNIIKNFCKEIKVFNSKTLRRLSFFCWLKLKRYDPAKGRAFNFFTTCILGFLRQEYRTKRSYKELKEKYQSYLSKGKIT